MLTATLDENITLSRICGLCGKTMRPENTGELGMYAPHCLECDHLNPTLEKYKKMLDFIQELSEKTPTREENFALFAWTRDAKGLLKELQ